VVRIPYTGLSHPKVAMFRNRLTRRLAPALLVLLAITSCSDQSPVEPVADVVSLQAAYNSDFTWIEERSPFDLGGLSISGIIGLTGGVLRLGGHTLVVPPGAVTVPTLFTISLPLDPYVNVDLTATVQTLLGGLLNVGGRGFEKPVALGLTYKRATNVTDPSKLFIAYVPRYGAAEKLPSVVDQANKVVWAALPHFSKYCMATD
ncbi:MAG TPA: hypothetical protein VFZ51_03985, partial [Woeseiaceae bacterium]